jgi:hypothetical protein
MGSQNKPRGRPFLLGNAGRPRGSKNKTTQILDQLAEGQAEQLMQKVIELANGGDVACLRMMLDRISPVRKGTPINIDLPPIKTLQDVLAVIPLLWTAIADGRLTPDEVGAMSLFAERSMTAIELKDFDKRIEVLEQKVRQNDEENP